MRVDAVLFGELARRERAVLVQELGACAGRPSTGDIAMALLF